MGSSLSRSGRALLQWVMPAPAAYSLRLGLAAALSFALASFALDTSQPPVLAPWTAVFALYPTVIESVRGALRRFAALALGALIAVAVVMITGPGTLAVLVVVTAAALVGRWPRLSEQGIQVPGGAVLVLLMAEPQPLGYLLQFGLETALGVGSALLLNAVIPPLHLTTAHEALVRLRNRISELLEDIAEEAAGEGGTLDWRDWGRRLDTVVAEASWLVTRSRESTKLNLRARRQPRVPGYTFDALSHAALEARTIARSLVSADDDHADRDIFAVEHTRGRLADALRETSAAVRAFGVDGEGGSSETLRRHLDAATEHLHALGGTPQPETRRHPPNAWSREQAVLVALGRLLGELRRANAGMQHA